MIDDCRVDLEPNAHKEKECVTRMDRERELDDALDVICRMYQTPDPSDPFNPLADVGDREPGYMFIGTRAGTFHRINEAEAYKVLDAHVAGDSEAAPQFLDDTVWPEPAAQ